VAVVALAAADAARDVAGVELGIKWPNDLVAADGRKVAGVLAEADLATPTSPDGLPAPVVVGVGMNVGWPTGPGDLPAELVGRAASLAELAGRPVDRDALLDAVLAGLEGRRADLDTPAGRHRQAGALRRACTTLGAEVRVDLGDAVVEGTARDLTPEGHLVVATGTGDRTVVAGDVVHLRPAPAPGGDGPGG
jgi:BirA family biotin operon repressor/biotin-[acetyl-CoA-carboxylase] ligase